MRFGKHTHYRHTQSFSRSSGKCSINTWHAKQQKMKEVNINEAKPLYTSKTEYANKAILDINYTCMYINMAFILLRQCKKSKNIKTFQQICRVKAKDKTKHSH